MLYITVPRFSQDYKEMTSASSEIQSRDVKKGLKIKKYKNYNIDSSLKEVSKLSSMSAGNM